MTTIIAGQVYVARLVITNRSSRSGIPVAANLRYFVSSIGLEIVIDGPTFETLSFEPGETKTLEVYFHAPLGSEGASGRFWAGVDAGWTYLAEATVPLSVVAGVEPTPSPTPTPMPIPVYEPGPPPIQPAAGEVLLYYLHPGGGVATTTATIENAPYLVAEGWVILKEGETVPAPTRLIFSYYYLPDGTLVKMTTEDVPPPFPPRERWALYGNVWYDVEMINFYDFLIPMSFYEEHYWALGPQTPITTLPLYVTWEMLAEIERKEAYWATQE